jgi:ESCRT-II complex subunit VPS22
LLGILILKTVFSFMQNDIKKSPAFRAQFHSMCAKCGVDPLASNKGFWAELLGIGDFYYELG